MVAIDLSISFEGPFAAVEVMARAIFLELFLYPNKYVNMSSRFRRGGGQKGKYD